MNVQRYGKGGVNVGINHIVGNFVGIMFIAFSIYLFYIEGKNPMSCTVEEQPDSVATFCQSLNYLQKPGHGHGYEYGSPKDNQKYVGIFNFFKEKFFVIGIVTILATKLWTWLEGRVVANLTLTNTAEMTSRDQRKELASNMVDYVQASRSIKFYLLKYVVSSLVLLSVFIITIQYLLYVLDFDFDENNLYNISKVWKDINENYDTRTSKLEHAFPYRISCRSQRFGHGGTLLESTHLCILKSNPVMLNMCVAAFFVLHAACFLNVLNMVCLTVRLVCFPMTRNDQRQRMDWLKRMSLNLRMVCIVVQRNIPEDIYLQMLEYFGRNTIV